ncbi:MAG TPA: hypothetical protein PLB78_05845, partial [Anaerolineae bacterium]|nr:hypothetical protein [Anaerolineae bacterium]
RYRTLCAVLAIMLLAVGCAAPPVPTPQPPSAADVAWLGTLQALTAGETTLAVTAEAPGTSWAEPGREAAVLTVWLDGAYAGDIVLFMGAEPHDYGFALGPVQAGPHTVLLAPAADKGAIAPVRVSDVQLTTYGPQDALYPVLRHSPLIYGRPAMNRSDTPLLAYHERAEAGGGTTISYTVIFSNEDGGTNPPALMARWGRVTDIEWVYSVTLDAAGNRVADEIQAGGHRTVPFGGERRGEHPLLRVATENNMVSDSGGSRLLFAPVFAEALPAECPREAVMDSHPWSYRVMAEERRREGMEVPGNAATPNVSDPRNYLYVTYKARLDPGACAPRLAAAVYDSAAGAWYTSDHDDPSMRVSLDGWRRMAIELPPGIRAEQLARLQLCAYGDSACSVGIEAVGPVFLLDEAYRPGALLWTWQGSQVLGAGGASELTLGR